ncbi:hypothetical protein HDU96_006171 [Phlyctochytrium bullatum]|nr:hypothetical protein HDU96_006171 [Phlyctochytrium bullatum]
MLVRRILTTAAALFAVSAASVSAQEGVSAIRGNPDGALPGTFLVEVDSSVADAQTYVTEKLVAAGFKTEDIQIRTNINLDNFKGASFTVPADESTEELIAAAIPSVNTFRVRMIKAPAPESISIDALDINKIVGEGFHALTGVNEARAKLGLTGKGIKVAVIDSGVDYMHPALGGGFGPGFRVTYGRDLVGDDYSFANQVIKPDNDPMDNCTGGSHGTHVAGIIGGYAYNITNPAFRPPVEWTGVAPEVEIGAYRVFGCAEDYTSDDLVTQAILVAAADGSHVINLSLGGGPVFADGPDAYAAEVVGKAGHIVVASNGNSQSAGLMTNGSPAVSRGAFGVASFDNAVQLAPYVVVEGKNYPYGLGSANGNFRFDTPYDVVAFSKCFICRKTSAYKIPLDIDAEDKNVLNDGLVLPPPTPINATGKALLVRWGEGSSAARCNNAASLGAAACIIYSNVPTVPGILGGRIPSLATTNDVGKALLAKLKAGQPAQITVSRRTTMVDLPTAGTVSAFSSPGLDPELFIKPDLGGIGGQVFATISRNSAVQSNSPYVYGTKSGTSMSSPYTAGAIALLLEAKGVDKTSFELARTLLMNTAKPANIFRSPLVDSVARQGAGLINVYNAITTKTLVTPSALHLNDTRYTRSTHYTLTVENTADVPVSYEITHLPAAMATPFAPNDDAMLPIAQVPFTADYAEVTFSRNSQRLPSLTFTLGPKSQRDVRLFFKPPTNAIAGLYPVYSGYIQLYQVADEAAGLADRTVVASVPYAGVVGAWRDAPIWSRKSNLFAQAVIGRPATNFTSLTGAYADRKYESLRTTAPWSVLNATAGITFLPIAATTSRYAKIEIVHAGDAAQKARLPGSIKHKTPLGYATAAPDVDGVTGTKKQPAVFAQLSRHTSVTAQGVEKPNPWTWWGEVTTDATSIEKSIKLPAGLYQVKFSGLKHFGRVGAKGDSNYDVVTSPIFQLVY